jgi:hypothetical protein
MRMTETMHVLNYLHTEGECTLGELVEATDIPTNRVLAALGVLVRAQDAVQTRHDGGVHYSATYAGHSKAGTWQTTRG